MKSDRPCEHRILAENSACRVTYCTHDTVHLNLGALTLRISPKQLADLGDLFAEASSALQPEPLASEQRWVC